MASFREDFPKMISHHTLRHAKCKLYPNNRFKRVLRSFLTIPVFPSVHSSPRYLLSQQDPLINHISPHLTPSRKLLNRLAHQIHAEQQLIPTGMTEVKTDVIAASIYAT